MAVNLGRKGSLRIMVTSSFILEAYRGNASHCNTYTYNVIVFYTKKYFKRTKA